MEVIEEPTPRYAGFWLRLAAFIIDSFILQLAGGIIALPIILTMVGGIIAASQQPETTTKVIGIISVVAGSILLLVLIFLTIGWLYYAIMESSTPQGTLGKMAVGIKVTDMQGNRITFARATGRFFGKIISKMILYVGFIMAGFTEKKQALHDIMADCLVVRKDY
ncbi:MAG TPA: RDD family protein [Williamwhitmania sp.]|nr:RDD family protein [Williamwhitmania sp.]HUX53075.1 RDD family protein [Williamwhitmania sp.]